MQAQAREAVYWPGIRLQIYLTMSVGALSAPNTKLLHLPRPMLPRNIPDGPLQDIAADYMTHNGHEYLILCDAFSKYPFVYKVMFKSAQSLCMHLLELMSQHGPPMSLSTNNGQSCIR